MIGFLLLTLAVVVIAALGVIPGVLMSPKFEEKQKQGIPVIKALVQIFKEATQK